MGSRSTRSSDAELGYEYRSGLERSIAEDLKSRKVPVSYETVKVAYKVPERVAYYRPDFLLPNGIIVEAKGWFQSKDRVKHLSVKRDHPKLDIRFVFANPKARLGKKSTTTYAAWCEKHGFQFAAKVVPEAWLREKSKAA